MELSVSEVEVLALLCCYAAYIRSFFTDVSGQPICSIFKGQEILHFLTIEDGNDRLSRNVGRELPLYAAKCPRRTQN